MFGLPVEMITMLGSSVLGGVMTIWGQSIKAKQEAQKMLLARGKFQMEEIDKYHQNISRNTLECHPHKATLSL